MKYFEFDNMDNKIDTKEGGGMIYMTFVAFHENLLKVI